MLIWKSGLFPRLIGAGIILAGGVYLTGSTLRFLAPGLFEVFAPAYGIPVLTELAFCLALLFAGWLSRRRSGPAMA